MHYAARQGAGESPAKGFFVLPKEVTFYSIAVRAVLLSVHNADMVPWSPATKILVFLAN